MYRPQRPNILVIWGDDIGWYNLSAYHRGFVGWFYPNIDRIANEGMLLLDYYGEQSYLTGRSAFITGQHPIRTGLTKVGMPGSSVGIQPGPDDRGTAQTIGLCHHAGLQNHLGDRDSTCRQRMV